MRASPYLRRLLLAGAAGVALLAIAALGTRGSSTRGGEGGAEHGLAYLLVGAIAGVALMVGVMARGDRALSRLARGVLHVLALSVPLIVLGVLAAAALREQRRASGVGARPAPQIAVPERSATPPPQASATPAARRDGSGAPPLWAPLLALALASGAVVIVLGRRGRRAATPWRMRRRAGEPELRTPADLGDPAAIADPRAAIVAAFARLEAELRAAGLGRYRGEGPIEYTERVAAARPDLAQPVRRLARAYAPARFSEHPVDAPMRRDALVALDAVRHALAPAAAATASAGPHDTGPEGVA